ncbi:hypothetical protein NDU88_011392 [Pleurodeles waltl]|uniref:Uncharacterized protein n=1 Tax=Pleurodeles waltl TaxID=8319 RepID=A0AAV7R382_PLEWA|nr:hypothetical protein NDU88_011392 [Pleurodeles waltl]
MVVDNGAMEERDKTLVQNLRLTALYILRLRLALSSLDVIKVPNTTGRVSLTPTNKNRSDEAEIKVAVGRLALSRDGGTGKKKETGSKDSPSQRNDAEEALVCQFLTSYIEDLLGKRSPAVNSAFLTTHDKGEKLKSNTPLETRKSTLYSPIGRTLSKSKTQWRESDEQSCN